MFGHEVLLLNSELKLGFEMRIVAVRELGFDGLRRIGALSNIVRGRLLLLLDLQLILRARLLLLSGFVIASEAVLLAIITIRLGIIAVATVSVAGNSLFRVS